jgi:hypothetical protein
MTFRGQIQKLYSWQRLLVRSSDVITKEQPVGWFRLLMSAQSSKMQEGKQGDAASR